MENLRKKAIFLMRKESEWRRETTILKIYRSQSLRGEM